MGWCERMRMRTRSRQTGRGKEKKAQRRWGCRKGSETRNLDDVHTKVGWQTVDQVGGRGGEGGRKEK